MNFSKANEYCIDKFDTSLATILDLSQNEIANELCRQSRVKKNSSNDYCFIGFYRNNTNNDDNND